VGKRAGGSGTVLRMDQSTAAERALPRWITPELIDDTLRVWNPYYRGQLVREDAVEILRNASRLLDVA
jgi:hypothetical protein